MTQYTLNIYAVYYVEYLLIILYSNGLVLRMFSVLLLDKRRQHTVTLDQHWLSCMKTKMTSIKTVWLGL